MSTRQAIGHAAERSGAGARERVARVRTLLPALVLAAVAAGLAWFIATRLFGSRGAFFAPVAAIITINIAGGRRARRAMEVSLGVPLGIALADVLVLELGSGTLQLVGIALLAMILAVLVGGGPLLITQSAVSAILVVALQPPTSGLSFTRAGDALVGCGVALLISFVIAPIDPLALARRSAEPVITELAGVLEDVAAALSARDRAGAIAALRRARGLDAQTQRFLEALTIGRETAAAAPQRWAARAPLEIYAEAAGQIDLAARNVRVLARGVLRAVDVGDHVPPGVPEAIRELGRAVAALEPWLERPERAGGVVDHAVRAARDASDVLEQTTNLSVSVIVGQVRSTAVDLLRSTGMTPDEARARIRAGDASRATT
ncbi:MAG TPA: FUSC family protein [Baekduia sp.]|nr:FUSC family protein [Baekduia sp.]